MTAYTSDKNGNLIEIAPMCDCGRAKTYLNYGVCDLCLHNPVEVFHRTTGTYSYEYISPEPTGLQAAARLQGELNAKLANLVLAATTAAGHITILNEIASQWVRGDTARFPLYAALDARDELLKAIQELAR